MGKQYLDSLCGKIKKGSCLLLPIRGNNSAKIVLGLYFDNSNAYACDVKLYCGLNANKL